MAASSNKTDEDIYVLDKEDESDVFSEESDDFLFDTSEEDSDSESDTSNDVHESEPYEEVIFFVSFCTSRHGASKICISWCTWSECSFWNVFRSLLRRYVAVVC
jgi:hypothetical protein